MRSQGHVGAPYTVTPAKLATDLGIQVHLRSENDAITSCFGLISTSDPFIHTYIMHLQSVLVIGMLFQGHVSAPIYHYTGQVDPRIWEVRFTCGVKMMP